MGVEVHFAEQHPDVDAVPQGLHDGVRPPARDVVSQQRVGMCCYDGIHIVAVQGVEGILPGIVEDGRTLMAEGSDVSAEDVDVRPSDGLIFRQACEGVEHAVVARIEGQSLQFPRARLPGRIGSDESGDADAHGVGIADGDGHYRPGLNALHLSAVLAHVRTDVAEVPVAGAVVRVAPAAHERFLTIVEGMIARDAERNAHVLKRLRHDALIARGGIVEAAAEVVAGGEGEVVGIDGLQAVQRLHHPGCAWDVLAKVLHDAGVEIVEGEDGNRGGATLSLRGEGD